MHSDSGGGDVPLEVAIDVLAHPRRRRAIAVLRQAEAPVSLQELARQMGARADERSSTGLTIALHHQHLPKLGETGLIEYDASQRSVRQIDLPDLTVVRQGTPSEPSRPSSDEFVTVRLEGEHR